MSKDYVECVHWDPETDAAPQQDSRNQNLFWTIIAVSAVICVLAISFLIIFWPESDPLPEPSGETTLSGEQQSEPGQEPVTQAPLSDETDTNVLLGMTLYQQLNYNGAIDAFDLSINANPSAASYNAYMYRGQCYFNLGNYNKAIYDFTQALRRSPANPQTLIMRGGSYYLLNCYQEAISDLSHALSLDLTAESASSAYSYRARAYEARGEYSLAAADDLAAEEARNRAAVS